MENADNEQSVLFKIFGNLNKERKSSEKIFFKKNVNFAQSKRRCS